MNRALRACVVSALVAASCGLVRAQSGPPGSGWRVLAWNDLGMHCMDTDYAVFSILPPFNNLHAQVLDPQGQLVTTGITLTYEAIADASGSINTTSAGKTDFWERVEALYGAAALPVDAGLAGHAMPGAANTPQPMSWDSAARAFVAAGIPITPWDDAGRHRAYPLMRVVARGSGGKLLGTADAVLPVSDEMDCSACHASGSAPAGQPAGGWVDVANADRDYRLNILRLHDEKQAGNGTWIAALAAFGLPAAGLEASVTQDDHPVLCGSCHATNALGTPGFAGVKPLTEAMHAFHGHVTDPTTGLLLEDTVNRSGCYRCHPGSETRCLRGVMGAAVAPDGALAIQCQSCHGQMADVGASGRKGWLDEPNCQACHTGTATHNNGQIRYTDAWEGGHLRVAVDDSFATEPNTPLPGTSLYKLSAGHGGLRCEACHGSTHAEYPGLHPNDNVQSLATQGHAGTIAECTACHAQQPATTSGGPHGMHPIGPAWVSKHGEGSGDSPAGCTACHGANLRGTVLSTTRADRTLNGKFFARGSMISCYACHNGPDSEGATKNNRPVVKAASGVSAGGASAVLALAGTDANGDALSFRILQQPDHGRVALSGSTATYLPDAGFAGDDTFRFTAYDGSIDAAPAIATIARAGESATWGLGYPGTGGLVPTLELSGSPLAGTEVELLLANTSGAPTTAWIYISPEAANRASQVGGRLLVGADQALSVALPAQGAALKLRLPAGAASIGTSLHLQALQADPGAHFGWAFSPGLRITPGP